jgi:hypothetical protein
MLLTFLINVVTYNVRVWFFFVEKAEGRMEKGVWKE